MALLAITPSDTVNIAGGPVRRIYVGVTGDVTVIDAAGTTVLFKAVAVGFLNFPMSPVSRVKATGTTATNMVGDTQGGQ